MKTLLAVLLLSAALSVQCLAQSVTVTGTGCASISVTSRATVGWQPTGSWTGTIQPKVSIAGQTAVNTTATPSTSTTAAATVTANGGYTTPVSGYTTLLFCGNTVTGTATIYYVVSERVH
jgi:hypothetical protein